MTDVTGRRAVREAMCPSCGSKVGEPCQDTSLGDWEDDVHTERLRALTDLLLEQANRTARRTRAANLGYAIGNELRRLRDDHGYSQALVARRAGLHRPIYARLERAEHEPTLSTLLPVILTMQGDPTRFMMDVLRRADPTRAVYPGFRCAHCSYFPLDAHRDEGARCEHPDLLPTHLTPRRELHVTGDRSPPTTCPLRKPK
jgi:DNA-binding XRE family transcriptional regulator